MSNRRNSLLPLFLTIALILTAFSGISKAQPDPSVDTSMGTLVSTDWLSRHLDDPNLVVLDCTVKMVPKEDGGMRSVSGRADFEAGHIPTAGFADLTGDLSDVNSPMNFAMPSPERFCAAMGALGVGDDSRVVVYDGFSSVWSARVWWMLRWIGFDRVAILDGGLKAWKAEERPLSTKTAERPVGKLTPRPRPELIADRDEVLAAVEDDAAIIVDAMPAPHFTGDMALYGRPGHIPSAINVPATSLVNESGRYRPHDELAAMCEGDLDARVITYCGAGVAASSNAFVMHRLGFTDVAVYMGSLQEWAADTTNPLVTD